MDSIEHMGQKRIVDFTENLEYLISAGPLRTARLGLREVSWMVPVIVMDKLSEAPYLTLR